MKKLIVFMVITAFMPSILWAQKQHPKMYHLLIGTYTNDGSKGIYVYRFNGKTGKTKFEQSAKTSDPSFLAVSADQKYVYAVNESHHPSGDSVTAFKFNDRNGKLTYLNQLPTYGQDPCYVTVDRKNKNLFVANYSSGSLTAYSLKPNGSLGDTLQTIRHTGGSVDTSRQKTAHVHAVILSPDEKYLLADDLGTDKVYEYRYQPNQKQPLTPAAQPTVSVNAGNGPRHLVFSRDAKHAYLVQEMGAKITVFNYINNKLSAAQTVEMDNASFKGQNGAADIHLSPDGKFLYASNRGEANDLVVFKVNKASGKLSFVQRQSCLGKGPRNFAIDPSGDFLLVANQISNDIFTFKVNKTTGKLTQFGTKLEVSHPVCLKFVPMK
ncbi:lactonase family protein [Mucilaginibacter sp.]|uniref:lactonase family protein n=1 Tax=Mucilaginibacter sp. TaxID=1882438 RepID=UPI003AFF8F81